MELENMDVVSIYMITRHDLHDLFTQKLTCSPGCGTFCVHRGAGSEVRVVWPGHPKRSYIYGCREATLMPLGLQLRRKGTLIDQEKRKI